jgi:hypothetical protein
MPTKFHHAEVAEKLRCSTWNIDSGIDTVKFLILKAYVGCK